MDIDGAVVLVTGASSGIGAATARAASQAGARVVRAARTEDQLRQLAAELGAAVHVRCDVTDSKTGCGGGRRSDERLRPDRRTGQQRRSGTARPLGADRS